MPLLIPGITPNPNTSFDAVSTLIENDRDKPCIEIVTIHLAPGFEKHMDSFHSVLQRISEAPGFQGGRWGMRVEKDVAGGSGSGSGEDGGLGGSEVLEYFIHWESFKAHQELIQTGDYKERVAEPLNNPAFSTSVQMLHFFPRTTESLTPPSTNVKQSAVTTDENSLSTKTIEVCTWNIKRYLNFPTFMNIHEDLEHALAKGPSKGVGAGPALEKEHVLVLVVGWDSVETHYQWKSGSDEGKKALAKVRDVINKVEMHHVKVLGEVAAPASGWQNSGEGKCHAVLT